MQAGPVVPKAAMRQTQWLQVYEDNNVEQGIAAGLPGKGMWAEPDAMAEMLTAKIGHPESGASTAWIPWPTAARDALSQSQRCFDAGGNEAS